jgi:hypothetical protein
MSLFPEWYYKDYEWVIEEYGSDWGFMVFQIGRLNSILVFSNTSYYKKQNLVWVPQIDTHLYVSTEDKRRNFERLFKWNPSGDFVDCLK